MTSFEIKNQRPYVIKAPEALATPRLLVFKDRVERNIQRMREYLEEIAPGSGFDHLCVHVKTNKSSYTTRLMRDAGIPSFKASLNEVAMLQRVGVAEVFVAYPVLRRDAEKLAGIVQEGGFHSILVQVGSLEQAKVLDEIARQHSIEWHYLIDIDVGMGRTGVSPDKALELYDRLTRFEGLHFVGLHGYDGHIHDASTRKREVAARRAMQLFVQVFRDFAARGILVPRVIVAGSPTFRTDFRILQGLIGAETHVQVSPGTWIYWDATYEKLLPGAFEFAALILAQVIETAREGELTLNLGHKRWSVDQGPLELFSHEGFTVKSVSEEHTVVTCARKTNLQFGDYVLLVPQHVCPTVNLYDEFSVVGTDGAIDILSSPVDARNR